MTKVFKKVFLTSTCLTMLFKIQPWPHQLQAIEEAARATKAGVPYRLLNFDPGVGKTLTAINIYRQWCIDHKAIIPLIIVAPLSVLDNWKRELEANCNGDIIKDIGIVEGQPRKKLEIIRNYKILIINYESLLSKDIFSALSMKKQGAIIIDEIHRIKTPPSRGKGKTTEAVIKLADKCKYRLGLTGTLLLNSLVDIWGPLRALGGDQLVHMNFHAWRSMNFYDRNSDNKYKNYPNWQPLPGVEQTLGRLLSKVSSIAKKSESLKLPPLIKKTIYVELTPEQKKHYKELERDFLTYYKSESCVVANAGVKMLRLQQVASGYLPLTSNDEMTCLTNNKLKVLEELLNDHAKDHKIIIWSVWQASYKQIGDLLDRLDIRFVSLTGETPKKDRTAAIDAFQNDPSVRVFQANPQAGGIGINLQAASMSIHYSKRINLGNYLQAAARNYRGGSDIHDSIYEIHLVAKGTADELPDIAHENKLSLAEALERYTKEVGKR